MFLLCLSPPPWWLLGLQIEIKVGWRFRTKEITVKKSGGTIRTIYCHQYCLSCHLGIDCNSTYLSFSSDSFVTIFYDILETE